MAKRLGRLPRACFLPLPNMAAALPRDVGHGLSLCLEPDLWSLETSVFSLLQLRWDEKK